jgi:hypothetical protein
VSSFAKLHRRLALIGGIATLIWGLSGLLHPFMTTFGPQQSRFLPPQARLDLAQAMPLPSIIRNANIPKAAAVRVVVGESGQMLQVTVDPDTPRRYFDLTTGEELPDMDSRHAIFLARHYLAESVAEATISSIQLITAFNAEYPWVNRLLPVYRVAFDTPDERVAFIYTETNALAAVNNRFKTCVQTAFRWLHTWDWIAPEFELFRVLLISLLVGSLALLALSGLGMLTGIRRRQRLPGVRGWHRRAAWVFLLPLLSLSVSGLYHLLQSSLDKPARTLHFGRPLDLEKISFDLRPDWPEISRDLAVDGMSLVSSQDGALLYRLSLARDPDNAPTDPAAIRSARFAGGQTAGPALYINASSGDVWQPGDRELALQLAETYSGAERANFEHVQFITRFGPEYDFRNKRLPVWRVDVGSPVHASFFVDTATGVLADRVKDHQKPERMSFSLLHKWNFLTVFGRQVQTPIVVATVAASLLFMAGLGLILDRRRRR